MAALPPGPRPSWEPDPPAPGAGAGTDALTVNALYPDGEPDWSSPQLDAAVLPEGLTRFRARRSTAPVLVVLGLVALVGSVVLLTTRGIPLGDVLRALGGALVPVAVTVGYLLWAARTARYRILVLVAFLWGTTELLAEYGLEDVVGQVRLSFLLPQVAVSPGLVGTPLVHALLTGAGLALLLLLWREDVGGVLDAVTYTGFMACGQALVVSVSLLAREMPGVAAVLVTVQAVVSTFCPALALGRAARTRSKAIQVAVLGGGVLAMVVLESWMTHQLSEDHPGVYLGVLVLLALAWGATVLVVSLTEPSRIRASLAGDVRAGRLTPLEVGMATSGAGRAWLRRNCLRPDAAEVSGRFCRAVMALALLRRRTPPDGVLSQEVSACLESALGELAAARGLLVPFLPPTNPVPPTTAPPGRVPARTPGPVGAAPVRVVPRGAPGGPVPYIPVPGPYAPVPYAPNPGPYAPGPVSYALGLYAPGSLPGPGPYAPGPVPYALDSYTLDSYTLDSYTLDPYTLDPYNPDPGPYAPGPRP